MIFNFKLVIFGWRFTIWICYNIYWLMSKVQHIDRDPGKYNNADFRLVKWFHFNENIIGNIGTMINSLYKNTYETNSWKTSNILKYIIAICIFCMQWCYIDWTNVRIIYILNKSAIALFDILCVNACGEKLILIAQRIFRENRSFDLSQGNI